MLGVGSFSVSISMDDVAMRLGSDTMGLFYAEFDEDRGPKIVAQWPSDMFNQAEFESISDYIITKKELCGSLLTVTMNSSKVMSYPLFVEDAKLYKRNAFLFAFGMVFPEGAETKPFQAVLRKLGQFMRDLEIEQQYLSHEFTRAKFCKEILPRIAKDLNLEHECITALDDSNTLALKVSLRLRDPPEVKDFQVPVRVRDLTSVATLNWDLTIQRVIPFIDGIRHVKKIAVESGVDTALVRQCIQQLVYYRCVVMIDIFQYTNMYVCTERIVNLLEDEIQRQCLQYISNGNEPLPPFTKVFQLYCSLQPCITFKDFCLLHEPASLNIDERRFVAFGVVQGIIRRIHKYPIKLHTKEREAELEDELERETQAAAQEAALEARAAAADGAQHVPQNGDPKDLNVGSVEAKKSSLSSGTEFDDSGFENRPESESAFAVFATAAEANEAARAAAAAAAAVGSKPLGPPQPPVIPVVDSIERSGSDSTGTGLFTKKHTRSFLEQSPQQSEYTRLDQQSIEHRSRVVNLVNGTNSYDAICAELWRSPAEVDLVLRYDKSIVILHK